MSNSRTRKEAHRASHKGLVKDPSTTKPGTLIHHVVQDRRFVLRPEDFKDVEVEVEENEPSSEKWFNPFGIF